MDETNFTSTNGSPQYIPVTGSARAIVPGATHAGHTDDNEVLSVTLQLRRPSADELTAHVEALGTTPPANRKHMTHDEFEASHGASDDDLNLVTAFATEQGLSVERINKAAATVHVSGTAGAFNKAFHVQLGNYQHPDFTYRGYDGPVHIPAHLTDIVTGVLGLDNRPQAKPHFRVYQEAAVRSNALAAPISYTPTQVAALYNFPTNVDCSGQCIGIIELGGGYSKSNLDQYFASLGVPTPTITSVSVDGGQNQPTGSPNGPDGEVDLDIEVAASVAPGAHIAVYFAPNTDAGFLDAITTAVHDKTNKPSVISISWGGPEMSWTTQAMQAMNNAMQSAAALGVTITVAAGDNGSTDGVNDGSFHVDFPASAPYALACGGTHLVGSGSTIESETVWNDGANGGATGGGVSSVFPVPSWQQKANVPPSANPGAGTGRGVPDVSGDADPATGYQVLVDGQQFPIGGTSAVAPLWAGLVALANQTLGKPVGYINPLLYSIPAQDNAFHDITQGNNDPNQTGQVYPAGPGWDACTGLGSPNGTLLIQALGQIG
ncbi:S53 family peptidase [Alicyclobacillus ferrooxydans]|uniref:Peptidase S53 n=1 Tax=Alicyclobacillus ferrooxydans TaxID=471514 RepID=A0A0P9CCQ9_9BACL|nr:S53 family serine peptidase [Alicyclobacillus ferrooxydans]KPV43411.1 peptidase S53 [Alicyclobacillus ferrooxydans]